MEIATVFAHAEIPSPLGPLVAVFSGRGLCRLAFGRQSLPADLLTGLRGVAPAEDPQAARLAEELARYFSGEAVRFTTPLDLSPGTAFQRRVWRALRRVPFGATISYGELARRAGCPGAARAVGQALGANPIPIIIPCHRVIRSDGGLGGFSAGLRLKRWLLRHERRWSQRVMVSHSAR